VTPEGRLPETKVTLCVRPERVTLAASGDGLPGIVEEAIYVGGETKYVVRLDDGQALTARGPAESMRKPGDRVVATFAAEHARVLEART
jgi:ABC-type Fe3+/spermidine/putrescine transport system ATPase subunit